MKLLVLAITLFSSTSSALYGYRMSTPSAPSYNFGGCSKGQVRHVNGRCVVPEVSNRLFLFEVPPNIGPVYRPRYIPKPKVERNVVFVRIPEGGKGPAPIVIPPPRRENVLFVLNKQIQHSQDVIELPGQPPTKPEVFVVNYADGENPNLPIGIDLQTALNSALPGGGQVVGSGGSGSGGSHVGFHSGSSYSPPFIPLPNTLYRTR